MERLALPFGLVGAVGIVGGYWTRTNNLEIDIVIADRKPIAKHIDAVGSIKWKENDTFDAHDLGKLLAHHGQLPGASPVTPLVVVARSGYSAGHMAGLRVIAPDELLAAWPEPV